VYGDDLGYNEGPFASPREFHHLLAPRMATLFAHIRAAGAAPILFHTCGNVGPLLPGVLELGVEALNVEPRLLGGLESLRRAIPADVILHGVTPLGELGAALTRGDRADVERIVQEIAAAHPMIVAEPGFGVLETHADAVRAAVYLKELAWVIGAGDASLTLSPGSGGAP
jgi:uroporphyrinogen-III decarboxylase